MGQKKNSKIILIIIILLIILIILTGVAYTYFATDIFKSNKELFFKYITQMGDEQNGFIDVGLKEYLEKKNNESYENNGTFTLNITSENGTSQEYDTINNFNISFSGQTDKTNNRFLQDISLNYSDDVTFPISYQKVEDTIGVQTKYVGDKYVAIDTKDSENEALEEISDLKQKTSEIGEVLQSLFSKEEWNQIQENYVKVINEQLQETQFTKIEENNKKGYKLSLTKEQIKNILIQLLETLKNDQTILDKINEAMEGQNFIKITATTIDNYIKDVENSNMFNSDAIFEITVFQQEGKTTEVLLVTEEIEIKIEKKKEQNLLQYIVSIETIGEEDSNRISFSANYTGLETLQNMNETYEVELQLELPFNSQITYNANANLNTNESNQITYKYQFNNQITFGNMIEIEEFSDENAMILNDYEPEQVSNFLEQVKERIELVNKKQMEELGLEESENPLIQMLTPLFGMTMYNQAIESIDGTSNNMAELEINTFNMKFEQYEGTNLKGATVKGLLSTIQQNNQMYEDGEYGKFIEIHFDGEEFEGTEQNISYIKSSIEVENSYRVEFEKDEDTGLIYRAVINKK